MVSIAGKYIDGPDFLQCVCVLPEDFSRKGLIAYQFSEMGKVRVNAADQGVPCRLRHPASINCN